jgi:hypothetical protein
MKQNLNKQTKKKMNRETEGELDKFKICCSCSQKDKAVDRQRV